MYFCSANLYFSFYYKTINFISFSNLELSLISTYVPDMPGSSAVESKNLVTM